MSVPVAVPARIPDHYRAPLERVIQGALVKVETVHRVGTGVVVDVEWEAADEGARRGLYIIEDDAARPFEDVASKVDELPAPHVDAAAPSSSPSPEPSPSNEKKRRFGFGKKEKTEAPAKAESAPGKPAEEPKKKGLFRRGK